MDNLGNSNVPSNNDIDKPIPFDDGLNKPAGAPPNVSRAPLNLGGGAGSSPAARPVPRPAPRPVPKAPSPQPVAGRPVSVPTVAPGEQITSCKIFFAKLHAGALDFLSDQISDWLKENPDVRIKHTNVAVGDVQAKKTEPNILITVWF